MDQRGILFFVEVLMFLLSIWRYIARRMNRRTGDSIYDKIR